MKSKILCSVLVFMSTFILFAQEELDIQTRLQMLRYIMDIKGGLEIGSRLGEILFRGEDVNFRTFNYTVSEWEWTTQYERNFRYKVLVNKQGYIINNDTLW